MHPAAPACLGLPMLRTTLALALSLVAALAIVPSADADHIGPCWHEYVEAGLAFALDHHSAKQLGMDVGACVDGTIDWLGIACESVCVLA